MSVYDLAAAAARAFPPEAAHVATIRTLQLLPHGPLALHDPVLATTVAGLQLPNPIGLAAGFDKNAEVPDAMLGFGFGWVECGTVTPMPQSGNPKPRLFRLTSDRAVINRMGFNNAGLDPFAARLSARPRRGIVGANIGANKDAHDRAADYITGLTRLWGLADYFTVNISSPNTPGLRGLQSKDALEDLLGRLAETRSALPGAAPVFLKVAPDLKDSEITAIADAVRTYGIDALIVSNTTLARPDTLCSDHKTEAGGLSGRPLFAASTAVLAAFYAAAPDVPLIGAGGVEDAATALAKIKAGARAIQFYSAMVFRGPGLARRIATDLRSHLQAEGFKTVADAVGTGSV
jgi:dihydroorotate dehydrogenase